MLCHTKHPPIISLTRLLTNGTTCQSQPSVRSPTPTLIWCRTRSVCGQLQSQSLSLCLLQSHAGCCFYCDSPGKTLKFETTKTDSVAITIIVHNFRCGHLDSILYYCDHSEIRPKLHHRQRHALLLPCTISCLYPKHLLQLASYSPDNMAVTGVFVARKDDFPNVVTAANSMIMAYIVSAAKSASEKSLDWRHAKFWRHNRARTMQRPAEHFIDKEQPENCTRIWVCNGRLHTKTSSTVMQDLSMPLLTPYVLVQPHLSMGDPPCMWNARNVKRYGTFSQWDLSIRQVSCNMSHMCAHLCRLR